MMRPVVGEHRIGHVIFKRRRQPSAACANAIGSTPRTGIASFRNSRTGDTFAIS